MSSRSNKDFPNFIADSIHTEGDYKLVNATHDDADYVSKNLRIEDVRECVIHGLSPWKALHVPIEHAESEVYTLRYKDKPMLLGGVIENPEVPDLMMGTIWLLGTYELNNHKPAFMRFSRYMLDDILMRYDVVENIIPIDHMKSILYLTRLGFLFSEEPIIVNGFTCLRFVRCAYNVEVSFE